MRFFSTLNSAVSRHKKTAIVSASVLVIGAASAANYFYDGTLFKSRPTSNKTYVTSNSVTSKSNTLYVDSEDIPSSQTPTKTFYYDPTANTYAETTTADPSSFDCGAPQSVGSNMSIVVCEPKTSTSGSGSGSTSGSGSSTSTSPLLGPLTPTTIFGNTSTVGIIGPYGDTWNFTNPQVKDKHGTVLATGSAVLMQTTPQSPKVVAYTISIPDTHASGQNLALTSVLFGCRPDLGDSISNCDGGMTFEYDTVSASWRLIALVDGKTGKAYVDTFAANNDFASQADLVSKITVQEMATVKEFPVVTVQNMGITLTAILPTWNWSKY
jgi:hypothetical protein